MSNFMGTPQSRLLANSAQLVRSPRCFAVGVVFAHAGDGGGVGRFLPTVPAFADVAEDIGDLFVGIDLGEREHDAFAIGFAFDGAGLAVEEDAGEGGDVSALFEPGTLSDGWGEEFVALFHALSVGAVAGGAEGLVDLLAFPGGGTELGE